jgi:DNA-binding protein HU-beta
MLFMHDFFCPPLHGEQNVAAGKRISMLGFGTFKLTSRAARVGRNPKTGEEIQIKASKTPSFSAGKAFKEKCN